MNVLNTARQYLSGAGTSTAALAFGGSTGSAVAVTEKYDGTSWTEVSDLATARFELGGAGTTNTSALAFAGAPPPTAGLSATEAWTDPVYTIKTVTVS